MSRTDLEAIGRLERRLELLAVTAEYDVAPAPSVHVGSCCEMTWIAGALSLAPLPMVQCARAHGHTRQHFGRDSRFQDLYVW